MRFLKFMFIMASLFVFGGCSRAYWANRARDGMDCVTATLGGGGGAKIMAGPINTGLVVFQDSYGLRGGERITEEQHNQYYAINSLILPVGTFDDFRFRCARFGMDELPVRTADFAAYVNYYPVLAALRLEPDRKPKRIIEPGKPTPVDPEATYRSLYHARQYYTQIELAVGILVGVRLGFNPGEMLDFLLGWTTLDIYRDDVYPYKSLPEKLYQIKQPCTVKRCAAIVPTGLGGVSMAVSPALKGWAESESSLRDCTIRHIVT